MEQRINIFCFKYTNVQNYEEKHEKIKKHIKNSISGYVVKPGCINSRHLVRRPQI